MVIKLKQCLFLLVVVLFGCSSTTKQKSVKACFTNFESLPSYNKNSQNSNERIVGDWVYSHSRLDDPGHSYIEECTFFENSQFSCTMSERGCFPNGYCDGHQWRESGTWKLENAVFELNNAKEEVSKSFKLISLTDDYIFVSNRHEKKLYYKPPLCK